MTREEMAKQAKAVVAAMMPAVADAARSHDGMTRISGLVLVDAFEVIEAMYRELGLGTDP